MKPLIRIGAERSLFPNPYLSRFDESTCMAGMWDRHSDAAFRYSFVAIGDAELNSLSAVSLSIAKIKKSSVRIIIGWIFHETGTYRVRSKFLESSLRRNGWDVFIHEGIALACRPMQECMSSLMVPDGCERALQGYFLIAGGELSLGDFCKPPLLTSIRHFCLMQRMQPSYEFVQGICERGISMMYPSTTADIYKGVVLIGPESRTPDLIRSFSDCRISDVFWDAEAPQAWAG